MDGKTFEAVVFFGMCAVLIVRLLFDVSATPEWIYLLAAVVIILMLALLMVLLRDVNDDAQVKTENNNKRNNPYSSNLFFTRKV